MNRTSVFLGSLLVFFFLFDNTPVLEGEGTVTIDLERSGPNPDAVIMLDWPSMDLSEYSMVALEPLEELQGIPAGFAVQFFGGYRLSPPGVSHSEHKPDDTVSFLAGQSKTGEYVFIFDTDNDENLANENTIEGVAFEYGEDAGYTGTADVLFEYYQDGRLASRSVDIEVFWFTKYGKITGAHRVPKFRAKVEELLTGTVKLGGIRMRMGLYAGGEYAIYDSGTSELILDTNGDGILDIGLRSVEVYKAGTPFSINETAYRVERVSPDGSALTLAVYDVDVEEKRVLKLGEPVPPFIAADLSGREISSDSFHGQLVLLDFWSTFCLPCIGHIPTLRDLRRDYGEKGFVIIGFSADRSVDKVTRFVKENQMNWHHVVDTADPSRSIFRNYNVDAIPAYFLVDRNGVLIAKYAHASQLRDLVASHLAE
ncbi:MAG: TlpA family protein disulfide reductase [Candidatus Latescibacteria bacterium]|nr:TlpA family protein disulfide reductase [Candidatus Latescibacterota bacterium]